MVTDVRLGHPDQLESEPMASQHPILNGLPKEEQIIPLV